ncbi:MAG TPA: hypothetical protein DCQ26_13995 [Marinilabiliales bacterium]|nr:MAG: hypothetical protein A2W95_00115 [Bacteroidetes bacterium GWA2_40_14]OFX57459.1 MAG: hypothetical protein A2W84_06160 [Bacteroidetes bacterium GWC2_40_13]OFX71683.1 MAG: hypothetical protein A2W96_09920 [Bacteroidetes bacterium GWD2_40_43]OFX90222.1 MAG: hypothetical protein A2W97_17105 [Bacteroidetes bacterium GWE2_40_63]OFY18632.1 MAG: hypothetical protein A2W88_05160 [Bacteroidetes bacterium GWF2_40_13]OFZ27684.1 MAG: hypothetical protein A2437_01830 [Bacteroidetes bacterium RIFOXYC
MKQNFYLLIYILLIPLFGASQILIPKKDYVPEVRQSRYSFAISLISGANSFPVSFGIMRQNPDSTHEIIFLTKESFLRQASGFETSRANPEKINYFEEYGIDPSILDELWRLKYDVFPYGNVDEAGWGTKQGVPSTAQFQMLSVFGINKMVDYTFGNKVWLFLTKVKDPVWQGEYQLRK